MANIELVAPSNFTFLSGASHPAELVAEAADLGLGGVGVCDRNSFAGVVRGHIAAREEWKTRPEFRYLFGVRLAFTDGTPEVAYPSDRAAYGRLCALLTTGNRRAPKGNCHFTIDDLAAHSEGQLLIVLAAFTEVGEASLRAVAHFAPGRTWLAANWEFKGQDRARLARIADLATRHGVRMLATNDVLFHDSDRKILHDVVTCIREHLTLETAGRRLQQNGERHIKPPDDMARNVRKLPAGDSRN
jgi:error-prone DNA polymerase